MLRNKLRSYSSETFAVLHAERLLQNPPVTDITLLVISELLNIQGPQVPCSPLPSSPSFFFSHYWKDTIHKQAIIQVALVIKQKYSLHITKW